jgi:peptidoglycan/LPS O-acetylase OafA/YrhL
MPIDRRLPVLPLAAVGLIVLGALGPWVTGEGFAETGETRLDSDRIITLVLALIVGGLLLAFRNRPRPRGIAVGIALCAFGALALALIDVLDVSTVNLAGADPSVGWGLWLTLIGSTALLATLWATRFRP